jgi:hypothetical protein
MAEIFGIIRICSLINPTTVTTEARRPPIDEKSPRETILSEITTRAVKII